MVDIIVCIKHVFEETEIRVDRERGRLIFDGVPTKVSDQDKNALEEAVRLRETHGGHLTALCLGGEDAKTALRVALAMGFDRAILLADDAFQETDAITNAHRLASAIKRLGKEGDLILCGDASTDISTAQVGPSIAEWLDLPVITFATRISIEGRKVVAERGADDGEEVLEADMPVLVSVSREMNQPRLPTVTQILSAGRKPILEWKVSELEGGGPLGSRIEVLSVDIPPTSRKMMVIEGRAEDIARILLGNLRKDGVLP